MYVAELIELLEQFDPEAEVRVAFQPSYPMEVDATDAGEFTINDEKVVYIATTWGNDYLPAEVSDRFGWR